MKKSGLILFAGIVITFFLGSCSKSCDCQLSTRLNPEKVALAAFPLKSNYIKNKVKLSNDWGVLKWRQLRTSCITVLRVRDILFDKEYITKCIINQYSFNSIFVFKED